MQRLLALMRKAVNDYAMIADGDKIAVGLSGGKDSIGLLALLAAYRKFAPEKFDLVAVNVDMGFADIDMDETAAVRDYCTSIDVQLIVEHTQLAQIIFDVRKEKNPCSLCAKMRRGALNSAAIAQGCNKIALGHHADDALQTLWLSLVYEGRISTFMPKSYMDKSGLTLIRPLIYAEEKYIRGMVRRYELPIINNPCPANKNTRREEIKRALEDLDARFPGAKAHMLTALFHPERNNLWDKALPPR